MHAIFFSVLALGAGDRVVTGSGLRIRAAPAASAEVVAKVAYGSVLGCAERSAAVTLDGKTGVFCKTKLEDGKEGWFFEPLTTPAEAELDAQLDRLALAKVKDLEHVAAERYPDLYDAHRFLLKRITAAKAKQKKLEMKLEELRLIAVNADAFAGDSARVYRDEAQGNRLRREAIEALVSEAAGTPVAEQAGWFLVEHGHDFECEGMAECVLGWMVKLDCTYLAQFPNGVHADEVALRIASGLDGIAEYMAQSEQSGKDLGDLAELRACIKKLKAPKKALQALDRVTKVRPAKK